MKNINALPKHLSISFPNEPGDFLTETKEYSKNFQIIERFMNGFFKQGAPIPLYLEVELAANEVDFLGKNHQLYLDAKDILWSIFTQNLSAMLSQEFVDTEQVDRFFSANQAFVRLGEQIFVSLELNYLVFKGYKGFEGFVYAVAKRAANLHRTGMLRMIRELVGRLNQVKSASRQPEKDLAQQMQIKSAARSNLKTWIAFIENSGFLEDLLGEYVSLSQVFWEQTFKQLSLEKSDELIELLEFILRQEKLVFACFFEQRQNELAHKISGLLVERNLKGLLEAFSLGITQKDFNLIKRNFSIFELSKGLKTLKAHLVAFERQRLEACVSLPAVVGFLESFFGWTAEILSAYPEFSAELTAEVQRVLNSGKEIAPKLFAAFLDDDIRFEGAKKQPIFLRLLDLLGEKEPYISEIYRHFCWALISDKGFDQYKSLLFSLKALYSEETLSKFTEVLAEVEASRQLLTKEGASFPKDLKLTVVGSSRWPFEIESESGMLGQLPQEFSEAAELIKRTFAEKNKLQELSFQRKHSICEVECRIAGFCFTVRCKLNQSLILLQFNKTTEWDINMLAARLKFPIEQAGKLAKKICARAKIFAFDGEVLRFDAQAALLLKEGVINLAERPRINFGFEEEVVRKSVFDKEKKEDFIRAKEKQIKAYIVRRLKAEDKVPIAVLLDALKKELGVDLVHSDVSGIMEELMSADFVKRSDQDINVLQYKK